MNDTANGYFIPVKRDAIKQANAELGRTDITTSNFLTFNIDIKDGIDNDIFDDKLINSIFLSILFLSGPELSQTARLI